MKLLMIQYHEMSENSLKKFLRNILFWGLSITTLPEDAKRGS